MNESSVIIDFNKTEIMEAYYKEKPLDYTVLHQWLRLHFGRAHRCENLKCTKPSKKFNWAKVKGCEYEFKRENFVMLCASCHYYYDDRFKIPKSKGKKK
jgi:hypothetical protein